MGMCASNETIVGTPAFSWASVCILTSINLKFILYKLWIWGNGSPEFVVEPLEDWLKTLKESTGKGDPLFFSILEDKRRPQWFSLIGL